MKLSRQNNMLLFPTKSPVREAFYRNLKNGQSNFYLGSLHVNMDYQEKESLRISCSDEEVLYDYLVPLGDDVMDSKAMATYLFDLDEHDESTPLMPTVEYHKYPDMRQQQLLGDERCMNLQLCRQGEVIDYSRTYKNRK